MSTQPTPEILQQREMLVETDTLGYIRALFEPEDFINLHFIHATEKWADDKGKLHARIHNDFMYITDLNESTTEHISKMQDAGWHSYVCMNPLKGERDPIDGKFHRRTKDVKDCRSVWVEIDENGRDALKKVCENVLAGTVPQPHFIVSSSPNKFYIIWRIQGFTIQQQRALNKALQMLFGGDPQSVDNARVLRLIGTRNLKAQYNPTPVVQLFSAEMKGEFFGDSESGRYALDEFKLSYAVETYEGGTPIDDEELGKRAMLVETNLRIVGIQYEIDNLLDSHDYVLFHFDCPWKEAHTTPGDTAAIFLRATGYGFKCFHQHCADRHWKPALKDWFQQAASEKGHAFNLAWGDMPFEETLEGKVLKNEAPPAPVPVDITFNPLNIRVTTATEDNERGMDISEVKEFIDNTDTGNAIRVLARDGKNIRYVKEEGEFIVFHPRKGVWKYDRDKQGLEKFVSMMVRQMKKEATKAFKVAEAALSTIRHTLNRHLEAKNGVELTAGDRQLIAAYKDARALLNWAKECESHRKVADAVGMLFNQPELDINISVDDLDSDRMTLNVLNGAFVFQWDGTITFRNHLRSDLCTQYAPVKADFAAECPLFQKFLDEMCVGDKELAAMFQEFFGLCLTGIVIRQFLILEGGGLDGKGTLTRIITRVLGNDADGYTLMPNFKIFTQHRDEGHGGTARSDVKQLRGKRLVVASEAKPKNTELNMQFLKQLTGKDDVNTRGNYDRDQTVFSPVCKIALLVNHPPKIADDSKAARDRAKLVKCLLTLPEDKVDHELEDRIVSAEASGILNWMLAGLQRCLQRYAAKRGSLLSLTQKVDKDSLLFHDDQNPMSKFVGQTLVMDAARMTLPSEVYARYLKYAAQHDLFAERKEALVNYVRLKYDLKQMDPVNPDSPILGIGLTMEIQHG